MESRKAAQQQQYICNKLLHGTLHVFILIGFSCTSQCLIQGDAKTVTRYPIPSANGCIQDTELEMNTLGENIQKTQITI